LLEEQIAFNAEMEEIFGEPLAPAALDRAETSGSIASGGIAKHGQAWEDAEAVFNEEWSALEGRSCDDEEPAPRIPKNAALMAKLRGETTVTGDDEAGAPPITVVPSHVAPTTDPPQSSETAELQSIYNKLCEVEAAVALMEEWGLEVPEDLRVLDEEDAAALAATLKKVPGAKLLRGLGFRPP